MKIVIDTDEKKLTYSENGNDSQLDLYSNRSFELLSHLWKKVGWNQKHIYTFTWLGRPIIQLPEDILRSQEVVYSIKPDVIIETGIAHGGSLILWASLCKAMNKGHVIGVDLEIRAHNREAIESHKLFPLITLIEGNSVDPRIVQKVKSLIKPDDVVLVFLDSNHTKGHVLAELEAYREVITTGSYIVVTDGIMKELYDVPRGNPEWIEDNPLEAALEFTKEYPEFVIEQPDWLFNESTLSKNITHWPSAWLRRL